MKTLKVISLAIVGVFLVNCDNSGKTMGDLQQKIEQTGSDMGNKANDLYAQAKLETQEALDKLKEGNYGVAQDMIIKGIKQQLPMNTDQNTTLVDISKENNTINYKYVVKNINNDALQSDNNKNSLLSNLKSYYCGNDIIVKGIRLAFPDGSNYNYFINDEKVLTLNLKPSDCEAR
ncbi:hypothetical protein A9G48_08740 [Gilliamella sp. wkB18]|jgi:hypothetical protein|uniref:hypothetical protein n=1 Tax=Gilliamella sp. wkB18 TaxID=3120260 RepID=UPI0004DD7B8E|nr:hypothetical protein [Gilliamella apicola]KFA58666.1 protein K [Gilliamella apicola]OCG62311.1 hypothetical protein A9G48_08740 [Gilliamella apicola]